MSDEPEISQSNSPDIATSKSKVSTLVIIFGAVAFLVSGMCTGGVASQTGSSGGYGPSIIWEALAFGAFGLVPAALFIFLGWWVGKRGHNGWLNLLLVLLGIYMVVIILFSLLIGSL